jgi:hypothetical protein
VSFSIRGVTDVPPAFNRLARVDFAVSSEPDTDVDWDGYCRAYALGRLTYEASYRDHSRICEEDLKAQLLGAWQLAWSQVRAIISRSWDAISRLEQGGDL